MPHWNVSVRAALHAEAPAGMEEALATTLRDLTKLRGDIVLVAPGSLANDGKLIDDRRAV